MRSCSRSSSISTSPTPRSSSVCDTSNAHPLHVDDSGYRHDLVTPYDERPAVAVGAGDLGVDEHVLHLLRAACEPVARPPASYLKARQSRFDPPAAPDDRTVEIARNRLEPEAVMLAHRLNAAAEVDALRADRRLEQLDQRRRHRPALVQHAKHVLARRRMDAFEPWQDLVTDQSAQGRRIRRVGAPLEPALAAVLLGLFAPHTKQRPNDAVVAADIDPFRRPAGGEPEEDRLDLVGERVPGGAQLLRAERVADVAQLGFRRTAGGALHDLGAEPLRAPR